MARGDGVSWASSLRCTRTGSRRPLDAPAFLSDAGFPLEVEYRLDPEAGARFKQALSRRGWDLWRYRELLPVASESGCVRLGEGGTPLLRLHRSVPPESRVWLKQEAGNPTGSFKDRGLTFGSTTRGGICVRFAEPISALVPGDMMPHPGMTVTVTDVEGLAAALRERGVGG